MPGPACRGVRAAGGRSAVSAQAAKKHFHVFLGNRPSGKGRFRAAAPDARPGRWSAPSALSACPLTRRMTATAWTGSGKRLARIGLADGRPEPECTQCAKCGQCAFSVFYGLSVTGRGPYPRQRCKAPESGAAGPGTKPPDLGAGTLIQKTRIRFFRGLQAVGMARFPAPAGPPEAWPDGFTQERGVSAARRCCRGLLQAVTGRANPLARKRCYRCNSCYRRFSWRPGRGARRHVDRNMPGRIGSRGAGRSPWSILAGRWEIARATLFPAGSGERNGPRGRIPRDRKINRIQGDPGNRPLATVADPFLLSVVLHTNYPMGPYGSGPAAAGCHRAQVPAHRFPSRKGQQTPRQSGETPGADQAQGGNVRHNWHHHLSKHVAGKKPMRRRPDGTFVYNSPTVRNTRTDAGDRSRSLLATAMPCDGFIGVAGSPPERQSRLADGTGHPPFSRHNAGRTEMRRQQASHSVRDQVDAVRKNLPRPSEAPGNPYRPHALTA